MSDSPPSAAPPPGWYADSPSSARLRWWSGSAWTDHYQAATEPVQEITEYPVETAPSTRAERRALQTAALATAEAEAALPATPPTRAEMRARTAVQSVMPVDEAPDADASVKAPAPVPVPPPAEVKEEPAVADAAPAAPAVAVAEPAAALIEQAPTPPQGPQPVAQPVADLYPDQILDRSIRTKEDRPLPPVVYLPQPSGYVRVPQSTFVPVSSQNGPATASMVLILIGLLGGAATYWFVSRTNSALAGLINLLILALLFAALALAVVGLVIAVRRPTKKQESVFALVVSLLLIGGVIALFAMRFISLGAVYAGG